MANQRCLKVQKDFFENANFKSHEPIFYSQYNIDNINV